MSQQSLSDHPQQEEVEEDLLLLPRAAAVNSSCSAFFDEPTDRFSHLHLANRPPCTTCGCHPISASCFSSGSHKRPSSENPSSSHEPNPKKPNNNDDYTNPLSGFSKIPLSPPPQETEPFLRRCVSDPYNPPIPPIVEEPPLSPPPNQEMELPGTPLSNAIASSKLPPRPPTLRRSVSDPTPSPAKTFCSSSESPEAERLRKMGECVREMSRKWDALLGCEADSANERISRQNDHPFDHNNSNDSAMENSEEGLNESVIVERKGDVLIINFKCPCGSGYQILLLGGNCYYKLM
ncbi:flocculation protein FLO11-like [Melia azedarach]|uniref:Flocculation protein FLO11-like n=1 Tax=Melia azedarach TaxID=155640 RepID=A0ACC1YJD1_MELAZ|nr:flocculation protein FLO11-like [Melia azedarach]